MSQSVISSIKGKDQLSITMVCLGNICRSPTAHAVFRQLATTQGLPCEVESAGTSASHKGDAPDPRSIKAAADYSFKGIKSRPVLSTDFVEYDLILAMDQQNLADLTKRCPPEQQQWICKWILGGNPGSTR